MGNNDNSVGVIVSYEKFGAALTGGTEQPKFTWWLTNSAWLEQVEVCNASYHGSPNGDSPDSVETFSPETVVISVGPDNS